MKPLTYVTPGSCLIFLQAIDANAVSNQSQTFNKMLSARYNPSFIRQKFVEKGKNTSLKADILTKIIDIHDKYHFKSAFKT